MATGNECVMIRLMADALEAVIAYDKSIAGTFARGEVNPTKEGIPFAMSEELDKLYLDMKNKTETAHKEFLKWKGG